MFKKCVLSLMLWALVAHAVSASEMMEKIEESTVSPLADMAMLDAEMKTTTEKPTVVKDEQPKEKSASQSPKHTVGDFIIHPLIAFKARTAVEDAPMGKQAGDAAAAVSSTTQAPAFFGSWPIAIPSFQDSLNSGFSSLSSTLNNGWSNFIGLGGSLNGLVDTPVRGDASSTSTTTTTPRPDVIVRVQHNRASTSRPLIQINQSNNRPDNNNVNEDDEDFDEDDDDDEFDEENDLDESAEDDEDDDEFDDDEEEEQIVQRPNSRRRPVRNQNRRGVVQQKRRVPVRSQNQNRKFRPAQEESEELEDDSNESVAYDDEDEDDQNDQVFYYSTKRSQPQGSFIQRGQQGFINQIRQLTRGQTPEEIGQMMRQGSNKNRKQATLLVNRNGQTIYVAPEMLNGNRVQMAKPQTSMKKPTTFKAGQYPQPPLTVPLRIRGEPVQYITIPWSKLGISPPSQLVSITEGIQSQPLLLNIPPEAITQMTKPKRKQQRPIITAEAVPLLTEASLMDIFKPPTIPPSRTTTGMKTSVNMKTKSKPSSSMSHRIRGGTVVEKAPAMMTENKETMDSMTPQAQETTDKEFIVVGDDSEPGVSARQHVKPVQGDARYIEVSSFKPYFEVLPNGRLALRKLGRSLETTEQEVKNVETVKSAEEQQIPVQILTDPVPEPAPGMVDPNAYPAPGMIDPMAYPAPGMVDPIAYPAPGMVDPMAYPAPGMVDPIAHPAPIMVDPIPEPVAEAVKVEENVKTESQTVA